MKIEREIAIGALPELVWTFLWDVPRVAACTPGASEVRTVEEGKRYTAVVADKVGPPERLRARAGGRDAGVDGLVKVDLDVSLTAAAPGTVLKLVADVAVFGKLRALGHSVIVRKGTHIVDRFAAVLCRGIEAQPR